MKCNRTSPRGWVRPVLLFLVVGLVSSGCIRFVEKYIHHDGRRFKMTAQHVDYLHQVYSEIGYTDVFLVKYPVPGKSMTLVANGSNGKIASKPPILGVDVGPLEKRCTSLNEFSRKAPRKTGGTPASRILRIDARLVCQRAEAYQEAKKKAEVAWSRATGVRKSRTPLLDFVDQVRRQPDVSVVAIEFYSDHCKVCIKEAPAWQALVNEYDLKGFKLLTVKIDDVGLGECENKLPWQPHAHVCRPDFAAELSVSELPYTKVWSWQGELLIEKSGAAIQQVESVLGDYFESATMRIALEGENSVLVEMLKGELSTWPKVSLIADNNSRERLARRAVKSFGEMRNASQQCKLGEAISENAVAVISESGGRMSLELQDIEKQSCSISVSAPSSSSSQQVTVKTLVNRLMMDLHRDL